MSYSHAVQNLFKKRGKKKAKTNVQLLKSMPKGWMLLRKNGEKYDNRNEEEIEQDEWVNDMYRKYKLYKTHTERFLMNITIDMLKENCSVEEINGYIETLFYEEEYEENSDYEESGDDSDYYDSDVSS